MNKKVMLSTLLIVGMGSASVQAVDAGSVLQTSVQVGGEAIRYAAAGALVALLNSLVRQGAEKVGLAEVVKSVESLVNSVDGASAGLGLGAVLVAKQLAVDPVANQVGVPGLK